MPNPPTTGTAGPGATATPLYRFLAPRYWTTWLGLGLMRGLVLLPYPALLAAGRGIGRLLHALLPRRRHVAATNLRLCFPDLDDAAQGRLLRVHFESLGMQLAELALAWWAPAARLAPLIHVQGMEHLEAAAAGGRGVVLLSAHFPAVELSGSVLRSGTRVRIAGLYRPSHNALVDEILMRSRSRAIEVQIPKDSMRQLLRTLARGYAVWYAPDQAYRGRFSALVTFFGVPAMTNTAITQIVRMSGAAVVPFFPRRRRDGSGYDVTISPALQDFPGADAAADAQRINHLLEAQVREVPEQYYWVHRRFKGRPGLPDPYAAP
jgi:KDO2-lipid IV(A) lauroyltransferase